MQAIGGPFLSTLCLFTACYILSIINPWHKLIRYFWSREISISHLLVWQVFILTLVLLILTPIMRILASVIMMPQKDMVIALVDYHSWFNPWQLFIWIWLLSVTPIMAQLLAQQIAGLTLRQALFSLLLFPSILMALLAGENFPLGHLLLQATSYFYTGIILSLIGGLIALAYFYCSDNFKQLLITATYKDNPKQKQRLPLKVTRGMLQIMVVTPLLYLMFGMLGLSAYYFACTGVVLVFIVGISLKFLQRE